METYRQFLQRIYSFEKPCLGIDFQNFVPSKSALCKVKEDNSFADFYGDTVVFDLKEGYKEKIFQYISTLYQEVPECFSHKHNLSTLHMTLHDLSSSCCIEEAKENAKRNATNLVKVLNEKPKYYQQIRMRTNYVINMVDTSIVLGLYPIDEMEYLKLLYWYKMVDKVRLLSYPFTPHITLAYYNRNGFDEKSAIHLGEIVQRLNQKNFELMLDTKDLQYQRFTSMNEYHKVFSLVH